ncbi:MAG: hypothetical protein MJZ30_05930 [Paludibacteraceae bacterium]|nr:hypothetical protein [Paludibacteraceae bacterium]
MKKTINPVVSQFKIACNNLANEVNEHLFEGYRTPYWVADEVGGICDFDGTDYLTPEEMVMLIENDVSYDQYAEWRDYNIDHFNDTRIHPKEKPFINLRSWLKGRRGE